MGHQYLESRDEFIKGLGSDLRTHLPKEQQAGLDHFLEAFFKVSSPDELGRYRRRDLIGSTLAFWRFVQTHDHKAPKLEVFNPDYENNGWHSTHTIIQLVHPDMPFIIDSLRMRLNERGITVHNLRNCILAVERDEKNRLVERGHGRELREAVVYIEIDRMEHDTELAAVQMELATVIHDVRQVVSDYPAVCARMKVLVEQLGNGNNSDSAEACNYLRWLLDNNFTFLAYEELEVDNSEGKPVVKPVEGERLGLLQPGNASTIPRGALEADLDGSLFADQSLLSFAKAAARSSVHRPAYPDFIRIKKFDDHGNICGEYRVMGLYTSPVYSQNPLTIPWLRGKIETVSRMSGLEMGSHHGKELARILEVFPREELFLTPTEQLYKTVMGILHIQERRQIRVFFRRDPNARFCSVQVYVPRDIYDTTLRKKMQNILCQRLSAIDAEFTTTFSESTLARVHYILRMSDHNREELNIKAITSEIIQAAYSWDEEFKDALLETLGEVKGNSLLSNFGSGFPVSYREAFTPPTAVADIEHIQKLDADSPLAMSFYRPIDDDGFLHFKVFHLGPSLPLADLIPIMKNLGLKVVGEHPYRIHRGADVVSLHDFSLTMTHDQPQPVRKVAEQFQEAFARTWFGQAENDHFNRLILTAGMNWRQVSMLRAYGRYIKQIRFGLSQSYLADTLCNNSEIANKLLKLFEVSFDPDLDLTDSQRKARKQQLQQSVLEDLDGVSVLSEDRVLRRYMAVITSTLRTNFYQLFSVMTSHFQTRHATDCFNLAPQPGDSQGILGIDR